MTPSQPGPGSSCTVMGSRLSPSVGPAMVRLTHHGPAPSWAKVVLGSHSRCVGVKLGGMGRKLASSGTAPRASDTSVAGGWRSCSAGTPGPTTRPFMRCASCRPTCTRAGRCVLRMLPLRTSLPRPKRPEKPPSDTRARPHVSVSTVIPTSWRRCHGGRQEAAATRWRTSRNAASSGVVSGGPPLATRNCCTPRPTSSHVCGSVRFRGRKKGCSSGQSAGRPHSALGQLMPTCAARRRRERAPRVP